MLWFLLELITGRAAFTQYKIIQAL